MFQHQAAALTFSGRPAIGIPAGAVVFSDPVDLVVPPMADLAIDVYLPGNTNIPSPLTMHNAALQTSYLSETGNHAGSPALPVVATLQNWIVLSRVEVAATAVSECHRGVRRLDYRWRAVDS